jgi:hypothetical protein
MLMPSGIDSYYRNITFEEQESMIHGKLYFFILILTISIFMYFSYVFAFRKKKLILFLRKFGKPQIIENLNSVLPNLKSHFRLVTLNCGVFVPTKMVFQQRVIPFLIFVPLVLVLLFFGLTSVASEKESVSYPSNFLEKEFSIQDYKKTEDLEQKLKWSKFFFITIMWLIFYSMYRLVKKVFGFDMPSNLGVNDNKELKTTLSLINKMSHWSNAPPTSFPISLTVTTIDAIWQECVEKLITTCNIILIDISNPSENLNWELEISFSRCPEKVILVSDKDYTFSDFTNMYPFLNAILNEQQYRFISYDKNLREFSNKLKIQMKKIPKTIH